MMRPNSASQQMTPALAVDQIQDATLRKNFQELMDYFREQNQLLDFEFFELSFEKETENHKVSHSQNKIPQDILVTKSVGPGQVTFNYDKFNTNSIDLSVSGPCIIRFFAGSYWNSGPSKSLPVKKDEDQEEVESDGVPVGVSLPFNGEKSKTPKKYLFEDGGTYSISEYPKLFRVIGYSFGGSGNYFKVPDSRGRTIRGTDLGSGRDPDAKSRTAMSEGGSVGDSVGSVQEDAFQRYRMSVYRGDNASPVTRTGSPKIPAYNQNENINFSYAFAADPYEEVGYGIPRYSSETRMKNRNVNFIIKAE